MVLGMFLTAESVKPLQSYCHTLPLSYHCHTLPLSYHCHTLPLSYQLHERQLLFYRRLLLSDNIVLHTLAALPRVRFEMLGTAAKYDVDDLYYSTETVKNAVWLSFVNNIRF